MIGWDKSKGMRWPSSPRLALAKAWLRLKKDGVVGVGGGKGEWGEWTCTWSEVLKLQDLTMSRLYCTDLSSGLGKCHRFRKYINYALGDKESRTIN